LVVLKCSFEKSYALEVRIEFLDPILAEISGEKEVVAITFDPCEGGKYGPIFRFVNFGDGGRLACSDWRCGGPQPAMVPFLVANMKEAGLLAAKAKSAVPLKMIPVGLKGPVAPTALGTVTTSATVPPAPVYRVEVPVPSLLTHQGLAAPRASPKDFSGANRRLPLSHLHWRVGKYLIPGSPGHNAGRAPSLEQPIAPRPPGTESLLST
jgi:hypothetical protein